MTREDVVKLLARFRASDPHAMLAADAAETWYEQLMHVAVDHAKHAYQNWLDAGSTRAPTLSQFLALVRKRSGKRASSKDRDIEEQMTQANKESAEVWRAFVLRDPEEAEIAQRVAKAARIIAMSKDRSSPILAEAQREYRLASDELAKLWEARKAEIVADREQRGVPVRHRDFGLLKNPETML